MEADLRNLDIEWLGKIPEHWSLAKIKYTHTVTLGKMLRNEPTGPSDSKRPYLRAAHVPPAGLTLDDPKEMWFTPKEQRELTLKRGDVVVVEGGMGGYGRADVITQDLPGWAFQNSINRLRPTKIANSLYTKYLLQVARQCGFIDVLCSISTMPHLTAEKLGSIELPLPPRAEQDLIAKFLDRETAKIDALIVKQEQLIATTRENKLTTIASVVKRGLDSSVQLKASDVDWLGQIPEHWTTSRIRYACHMLSGFPFKSEGFTDNPSDARLLRGINVGVGALDWDSTVYWPFEELALFSHYEVRAGDIIMGLDRPLISAGSRISRVTENDVPALLVQRTLRLRARRNFVQEFLAYVLAADGLSHHITPMFTGVSVPHVSPDQVASFQIPQPPYTEQSAIVLFLDRFCSKVDILVEKSIEMIATLREYRSALITDAVTGKIDVRRMA